MSFFRYPGGKSKLRGEIISRLTDLAPRGDIQYREPFFGGGSIGLKFIADNPAVKSIWINDKDIGISCLWTSVIRHPESFKSRVMGFTPSIEAFYDIRNELLGLKKVPESESDIVDIGFKKMAIHQISYSGLGVKSGSPLGGNNQRSIYKIDCRWSPSYICKKIDAIHARLSSLSIFENRCTCLDFSELLKGDDNCLIYLDPPYYVKGNGLYQHGFTAQDHIRLMELLLGTRHSWLLSYDDDEQNVIRKLYYWASLEPIGVNYSITAEIDDGTRPSGDKETQDDSRSKKKCDMELSGDKECRDESDKKPRLSRKGKELLISSPSKTLCDSEDINIACLLENTYNY